MKVIITILIVLIALKTFLMQAQNDVSLYFIHDLPQNNLLNPAEQISCKVFVGIPLLSSIHAGYDNSLFTYRDVLHSRNDSLIPDFNYFLNHSSFGRIENLRLEAQVSLIHFGFKFKKKYYFNFGIHDKIDAGLLYPINLVRLPFTGNTPYVGETYQMNGLRAFGIYYREWAFGLSKIFNPKLTAGLHFKLLFGKMNIHSYHNRMSLFTNSDIYQLAFHSDIQLNASPFMVNVSNNRQLQSVNFPNNMGFAQFLLNRRNKGVAFDLGVIYKYDEKISLSASALDLGFIYWRTYSTKNNFSSQFNFDGLRYNPITGEFENLEQIIDSLQNSYTLTTEERNYITALSPKIYVGGTYTIYDWLNAGILNRSELYHNRLHTSLTISMNAWYKSYLAGTLSWTYIHKNLRNFGMGISARTPVFGFYAITDNLYGILKYKSTQFVNIRFGFNLLFGCSQKVSDQLKPGCAAYENIILKKEKRKKIKK